MAKRLLVDFSRKQVIPKQVLEGKIGYFVRITNCYGTYSLPPQTLPDGSQKAYRVEVSNTNFKGSNNLELNSTDLDKLGTFYGAEIVTQLIGRIGVGIYDKRGELTGFIPLRIER